MSIGAVSGYGALLQRMVRVLTSVLGGAADSAVGAVVGAVWLAEHCVHVCSSGTKGKQQ